MSDLDRIDYYSKIIDELLKQNIGGEELFWAYIERGITYYNHIEYDKAISDFESAISINPDEPVCYFNLALIYKDKYELEQAEYYFKKVIEIEKNNSAYFELGLLYNQKNEYSKAIEFFDLALSYGRKTSDVFYNRALSYIKLNEDEKALKDLSTAIRIKPSNSNYYITRANIHIKQLNYTNAIDDFTSAIKLKPDNSLYRVERAILNATIASLIKISRKNTIFHDEIKNIIPSFKNENENIYYELSEYDISKAIDIENYILKVNNINPLYYITRGAIYQSFNRFTESVMDFVMAKKNIKSTLEIKTSNIYGDIFIEKHYLMLALVCLYLEEYEDCKTNLDIVFNNESNSEKLDILYSCYWWKKEKNFDKSYFWYKRALEKGFNKYDLIDDIFEGYFLNDFAIELKKKGLF